MSSTNQFQNDIKQNLIKQGLLIKRSRILKQWKQRWMVLTKTHLYSFSQKGIYKNPTETVPLNTIQTLKSYYKDQYQKPWIFRIESPDVNIYLSAKDGQDKWSWMTALEKMIDRTCSQTNKIDSYNQIRESIKMTSAFRESLNSQKSRLSYNDSPERFSEIIKCQRLSNLSKNSYVVDLVIPPPPQQIINIRFFKQNKLQFDQQTFDFQHTRRDSFAEKGNTLGQHIGDFSFSTSAIQPLQKQKIIEKIIQKERIIYIPEVRQKIVEKIVYVNENQGCCSSPLNRSNNSGKNQQPSGLNNILINICSVKSQKSKPLVDFVAFLLTQKFYTYHSQVLQFCLKSSQKQYFSELILLALNQQSNEAMLNSYIRFITHIYEINQQYFHSSDIKLLVDILIRQLSMNRSQFNQFLIVNLFKVLSDKYWWKKTDYRKKELINLVKAMEKAGNHEVQYISSELLSKM